MSHRLFDASQQSHASLTLLLIAAGVSFTVVGAFALYVRWKGRHARKAARLARELRKADRKRRRRGRHGTAPG